MERTVDLNALKAAVRCAEAAEVCDDKATKDALERASVRYWNKMLGRDRSTLAGVGPHAVAAHEGPPQG